MDKKPLYLFEPLKAEKSQKESKNEEILKSAVAFMNLALSIMTESDRDQMEAFRKFRPAVVAARQRLNDNYLNLEVDVSNSNSPEARFILLAKKLEDVASNLSDSYVIALE